MDKKVKEVIDTLDEHRPKIIRSTLTEDQIKFLELCRENERPVPWSKMAILWERCGWGRRDSSALHKRYMTYKLRKEEQKKKAGKGR